MVSTDSVLFVIETPLKVHIRTTEKYWRVITTIKHPSISKHIDDVRNTLKEPDQIRKSKKDQNVHLYYKNIGEIYICIVTDHISESEGYIITAYLTDRIKEGEQIYVKN